MEQYECSWNLEGSLSDPSNNRHSGVYLFVYEGKIKRLIYVGTAYNQSGGFTDRWGTHINLFKVGGRTTWWIDKNEDIYDLMTIKNKDLHSYIKDLRGNDKVWCPTDIVNSSGRYKSYFKNDYFNEDWKKYVNKVYLPSISVYSCEINDENVGRILETKIQVVFGDYFKIGYCNNVKKNWLGSQQGDKSIAQFTCFKFTNYPEIDSESLKLLKNLDDNYNNIYEKEIKC